MGRLRKVITQAREDLAQREDPWRYLKNLERVIGMTEEERDQWWGRRLRQMLGDFSMPAELIDDFMVDYRDFRKRNPKSGIRNSEKEMDYILALENGEQDRLIREVYEKLGRARGMDADQAKAKMLEHAKEIGLAMKADPGDPAIQDYVDNYVSLLAGPGTEADLKRVFDGFCEPFHRRMFTVADSIKGGDRGEKIYQMILANLRLRLERVSAGA